MKDKKGKETELIRHLDEHSLPLVRTKQGKAHPHKGAGKLLAVNGSHAIIKPFRHKKTESVPIEDVEPWKSRSTQNNLMLKLAPGVQLPPPTNGYHIDKIEEEDDMPTPPILSEEFLLVLTLLSEDILKRTGNKRVKALGRGDFENFLRKVYLDDRRNLVQLRNRLKDQGVCTCANSELREALTTLIEDRGTCAAVDVIECLRPATPSAQGKPAEQAPAAPVQRPAETAADVVPKQTAEADETEKVVSKTPQPRGAENTGVAFGDELVTALRRVIRDRNDILPDDKYRIESAILGVPQLNETLDRLGVDDAVSENLVKIMGHSATPEGVREARHTHWPAPPKKPNPEQALEEALSSGELAIDSVVRVLLSATEHNTLGKLARHIVAMDLEDKPPLPPL